MSSLIADMLFDNKEQIPDGLYLQLMNTLKLINDTGNMPLTLTPVVTPRPVVTPTPVVTPRPVVIPRPVVVNDNKFYSGTYIWKDFCIFKIEGVSKCFISIILLNPIPVQEYFSHNFHLQLKMKNDKIKIKTGYHNGNIFEFIDLNKKIQIIARDLIPERRTFTYV